MRLPVRHPCSSPLSPQSPENRGAATEKREGGGGLGAGTGASGPAPAGEDPGQVRKIRMNPTTAYLVSAFGTTDTTVYAAPSAASLQRDFPGAKVYYYGG